MYKVIIKINYEYAHRLVHHQGKCRHVHGHSGEATIELCSETLDSNGFVMDFSDLKAPIKQWISDNWDHAYLANQNDPLLSAFQAEEMKVYRFPEEPSAEVMARHLYEKILTLIELPMDLSLVRVTVQEGCMGMATYQL